MATLSNDWDGGGARSGRSCRSAATIGTIATLSSLDPVGGSALLPSSQPWQRSGRSCGPVPCGGGELRLPRPDEEELEVEVRDTKMEGKKWRGEASAVAWAQLPCPDA